MDIPRQPPRRRLRWLVLAAAVVAGAASTVAVARREQPMPPVERSGLWIAAVEHGEFVREVRAPGVLVPRQRRWVTATTAGRVESLRVEAGDIVEADTFVVELRNPDLELAALEAQSDRAQARAALSHLEADLETNVLTQRSALATLDADFQSARREREATGALAARQAVARDEADRAVERLGELTARRRLDQQRLEALRRGGRAQVHAERTRVERLSTVAEFRREQVRAQNVVAGQAGVVQEVMVEPGQWVQPGDVLAKVADPTILDAELQVPQVQAKDLVRGLAVQVDTRAGVVRGEVVRVDPSVREGTVTVEVALPSELPRAARPDLSVEGTIELARQPDTVFVQRPVHSQPGAAMQVFVLAPDGTHAVRRSVEFGDGSASTIEVVRGARTGDQLIVSDMAQWADHERVLLQ